MSTSARDRMVKAIWHGVDPFDGFPHADYPTDHQGWTSNHPYLRRAVRDIRPRIIVEIGVWKGGSVKTMAKAAKEVDLDCVILAIDTWLGSYEHWLDPTLTKDLRHQFGYPRLFHTFVSNVFDEGVQDYVLPLPMDSINGFELLKHLGVSADLIHIDAGHDYRSVSNDIQAWWTLLRPGGILIGDDYWTGGEWPGVKQAIDEFLGATPHHGFTQEDGKCLVFKD